MQPSRPGFPNLSGPLFLPLPLLPCLVRCMVPERGRPGVTSPASLPGTVGGGWERLTPNSGHPSRGCYRPQRINGAEATHFLWPGDRLNHTAPHCWQPLSQEVPPAPSGGGSWPPHAPGLAFLCLLEAGELGTPGVMRALIRCPHPWEVWTSPESQGHCGGRSWAGPGTQLFQTWGPREVKDELEGVRFETWRVRGSRGRKPSSTRDWLAEGRAGWHIPLL